MQNCKSWGNREVWKQWLLFSFKRQEEIRTRCHLNNYVCSDKFVMWSDLVTRTSLWSEQFQMLRLITTQSVDKWLSNTILPTPRFMDQCRKNVRNKKDTEEAISRVEHSSGMASMFCSWCQSSWNHWQKTCEGPSLSEFCGMGSNEPSRLYLSQILGLIAGNSS